MFLFLITTFASESYYIKQLNNEKYLDLMKSAYDKTPTLGPIEDADKFVLQDLKDSERLVKLEKDPRMVFDIASNAKLLIMFPAHMLPNQRFTFQPRFLMEKKTKIMNKGKCLTYVESKKWYELDHCSKDIDDEKQVFEFLTEADIGRKREADKKKIEFANGIKELMINEMSCHSSNKTSNQTINQINNNMGSPAEAASSFSAFAHSHSSTGGAEGVQMMKDSCEKLLESNKDEDGVEKKDIGGGFLSKKMDKVKDKLKSAKDKIKKALK